MKRALLVAIATMSLSLSCCSIETGTVDFEAIGLSKEAADNAEAALRSKQPGRCHDLAAAMGDPNGNSQDYTVDAEEACSNVAMREEALHPRKLVPPRDPKMFEPPPVTTPPEVFEHMTQAQIQAFNRKQIEKMCASGHCSKPALTPEEYRNAEATLSARSELELRQAGLPSDTARNAIWAMKHAPESSCANLAGDIVSMIEAARVAPDNAQDPTGSLIEIETNHYCDKKNIKN